MSYETYGFFQKEFLRDKKGKLLKSDEVFLNIYDFWVLTHAPGSMKVKRWYHPKLAKLEKILRKKWEREQKKVKTLPIINIMLRNIREEVPAFNPVLYLEDKEQYFANLESWKLTFEDQLIERYPFLVSPPSDIRRFINIQEFIYLGNFYFLCGTITQLLSYIYK